MSTDRDCEYAAGVSRTTIAATAETVLIGRFLTVQNPRLCFSQRILRDVDNVLLNGATEPTANLLSRHTSKKQNAKQVKLRVHSCELQLNQDPSHRDIQIHSMTHCDPAWRDRDPSAIPLCSLEEAHSPAAPITVNSSKASIAIHEEPELSGSRYSVSSGGMHKLGR